MIIGVPKETMDGERRVALVPEVVAKLVKSGFEVQVEKGAGISASFEDKAYEDAGAKMVLREEAFQADLVTKIENVSSNEISLMKKGGALISFMRPLDEPQMIQQLANQGVTGFAMELVPRITRAQKMDALSAMSSVAGYKAVLLGADTLPKFLPLLTTAAGTIRPATVFVLGVGVAGLQALATARRLGAVTWAYDVRAAAAEEAKSLGAKFIDIDLDTADAATSGGYAKALSEDRAERQIQLLEPHIVKADIVISTALIPGRKAPILISADAVKGMKEGSVIVDMAAPNGGNCALTEKGKSVKKHGVLIHGVTNLVAGMPLHASQLYARTIFAAIEEFTNEGKLILDFENEITQGCCVCHDGEVVNERIKGLLNT